MARAADGKARGRVGIAGSLVIGLAVACCLFGGGLAVLSDPIATSVARDRLAEQGIECDDRLSVDLGWALDVARIAPTTCTMREGDVAAFELLDPVTIELGEGFEARLVTGGRARVVTRIDPPVVHASGLGAIVDALEIPDRIGMLVAGAARLSGDDLPQIEMGSIEVARDDRVSALLTGVHLVGRTATTPLALRVDRADLPAIAGPLGARATIAIAPMSAEATPSHATLEGDLRIDASLPLLGGLQRDVHLAVVGDGLDGPTPRYDIQM